MESSQRRLLGRCAAVVLAVLLAMSFGSGCRGDEELSPSLSDAGPAEKASAPESATSKAADSTASKLSRALDWNEAGIRWLRYDAGVEEAERSGKPILVLVYADWCPHCKKYGENFYLEQIEALAKDYVMVLVNQDKEPATSQKLSPDGTYTPRTFVLSSKAEIREDIFATPSRFRYFYDYRDPSLLVRSMERGLESVL